MNACVLFSFAAVISKWPMSTTTVIGSKAQFHCSGSGFLIHWEMNGLPSTNAAISGQGIMSNDVSFSLGMALGYWKNGHISNSLLQKTCGCLRNETRDAVQH